LPFRKEKTGSGEEADFDPNAAFFTKVVNKKKKGIEAMSSGSKKDKKDKQQNTSQSMQGSSKNVEDAEDLDPLVLRSRQLASELILTYHQNGISFMIGVCRFLPRIAGVPTFFQPNSSK
jgi:hypothetical protein